MESYPHLLKRLTLAFAFVVALVIPAPALAKGAPATETVITTHFTKSIVLTDNPPCVGTVTYDLHDTFHITEFDNGVIHVADNQTGDATFASDVDGQVYTGRFTGTFNLQANEVHGAFTVGGTYNLRVQAPDGSAIRFRITARQTFKPSAEETVVDVVNVHCSAS